MTRSKTADILGQLRAEIDKTLIPLIVGHEHHICLIDPPNHSNVGDSAILLGELKFLKTRFPDSKLSFFDIDSYSERCESLIDNATIILIHGGGNFGDLYPRHQELRERLLQRYPHKRIVQLPQSISFSDTVALKRTADAIAAHSDFHMLVRDKVSHAFANVNFACKTWLSPDMAFMLDLLATTTKREVFCLLRSDKEAVANHDKILETIRDETKDVEALDWIVEPDSLTRRIDRRLVMMTRRWPSLTWPFMSAMLAVRSRYAGNRVAVGIELLSRGKLVVTDRLHAHIMCCIMGIPNLIFDSFDGKVSALYRTWTHAFDGATLMTGPDSLNSSIKKSRESLCDESRQNFIG